MSFTRPTTEQLRPFDEGGSLGEPNALPAETLAYFSSIKGVFAYFSLQLGDPAWAGKNVLDFGGSIGAILRDADSTIDEERYWCLDVNREALERGKADYPKAHWVFYNRYCFEFNPRGIPALPIPDLRQTFDYIIAFSVFTNNTVTDMLQLVSQLEGLLAPGGALAFTFIDPFHFISPGQSVFQQQLERRLKRGNITAAEMKDLTERVQGAKWFMLVNDRDLYVDTEEIRHYEPGRKKSCYAYHAREYMKALFPHAMILPPVNSMNNMRQHCCVIRKS
jgi:SAM-dependent methyltransferase